MFENVVVGVTESGTSNVAVERAMKLTEASGGMLHLVAAFDAHRPPPPVMPEEFRYSIGSLDPVDVLLNKLEAKARAAAIRVTKHAVLADPVEALTRIAAHEHADLIVVGDSSAHGVRHRSTVSDALMSKTECAVLVV
jgi:nucleotide-binding universal stress UspA family protein